MVSHVYRYNMFKQEENKKLCEEVLNEIANRYHITISELSVMPDHIHAVVGMPSAMSISQAFHLLKGASAHEIFERKPHFRHRYPKGHLWSPGTTIEQLVMLMRKPFFGMYVISDSNKAV